ncbi:MAG: hypothetical protein ACD_46C00608G0007 [uncultured bacterium]|nr:MAG: hypothetical protein ACD_46C00608G0007 [uncultured bacterium]
MNPRKQKSESQMDVELNLIENQIKINIEKELSSATPKIRKVILLLNQLEGKLTNILNQAQTGNAKENLPPSPEWLIKNINRLENALNLLNDTTKLIDNLHNQQQTESKPQPPSRNSEELLNNLVQKNPNLSKYFAPNTPLARANEWLTQHKQSMCIRQSSQPNTINVSIKSRYFPEEVIHFRFQADLNNPAIIRFPKKDGSFEIIGIANLHKFIEKLQQDTLNKIPLSKIIEEAKKVLEQHIQMLSLPVNYISLMSTKDGRYELISEATHISLKDFDESAKHTGIFFTLDDLKKIVEGDLAPIVEEARKEKLYQLAKQIDPDLKKNNFLLERAIINKALEGASPGTYKIGLSTSNPDKITIRYVDTNNTIINVQISDLKQGKELLEHLQKIKEEVSIERLFKLASKVDPQLTKQDFVTPTYKMEGSLKDAIPGNYKIGLSQSDPNSFVIRFVNIEGEQCNYRCAANSSNVIKNATEVVHEIKQIGIAFIDSLKRQFTNVHQNQSAEDIKKLLKQKNTAYVINIDKDNRMAIHYIPPGKSEITKTSVEIKDNKIQLKSDRACDLKSFIERLEKAKKQNIVQRFFQNLQKEHREEKSIGPKRRLS